MANNILDTYPDLSREPEILGNAYLLNEYQRLRENGEPHGFAAMLVLQSPPSCMTDSVYFEGRKRLGDEIPDEQIPAMERALARQGFKPNETDVYDPGLARFQWDKEAFVPASGGRGYIKKLLEKRGWGGEGPVKVKARVDEPAPPVPLAEDLIAKNTRQMLARHPEMGRKRKEEIREAVIAQHGLPATK